MGVSGSVTIIGGKSCTSGSESGPSLLSWNIIGFLVGSPEKSALKSGGRMVKGSKGSPEHNPGCSFEHLK